MRHILNIKASLRAGLYALKGFYWLMRHERAFAQEVLIAIPLAIWAFMIDLSPTQRLWLIAGLFLVLIVEALNTAIERLVDRVSLDIHPLSGAVKDIASAAVFLSILLCALIWLVIMGGHYHLF